MNEARDDEFKGRYEKLNDAQRAAVDTIEGPLLVVAGPGSGKTELLSIRAANILNKTDAYASDILCLTFTEAAEINMRRRLTSIIGSEANHIKVHTFHNFCRRIRENFPEHFGVTTDFSVADDIVRTEILEEIFISMDHDNPLRSEHPELGFVFLKPVMGALANIKQAGLDPEEFRAVLDANAEFLAAVRADVDRVFSQRASKELFDDLEELLKLLEEKQTESPVPHFHSLAYALSARLERALNEAKEEDSTKPITEFKNTHTVKEGDGRILKTDRDREKLQALADVYAAYEKNKYDRGFYDFDDMILEVIHKLEEEPSLRAAVAEVNNYIMVDEFQDTNDAQLRLILAIAQEAPEDSPNLMVVGDDDQAIYRFQGAEVSNILNFKHTFVDTKVVTLTKNYRSKQEILDISQTVIDQGEERLATILAEVEKKLEAAGEITSDVSVAKRVLPTRTHHNHAIALRAKELIASGESPDEIAILGRRHQDLEALVPYLHEAGVPITYERQQNVLAQPHIRQLIAMCRLITELGQGNHEEAESLLPEVLSYSFWGLERAVVWELSLAAKDERKLWLVLMRKRGGKLAVIADFFLHLSERATHEPVEYILEALVGAHELSGADDPDADEIELSDTEVREFTSPFKSFYFSRERLQDDPAEYLRFLSSLKTFVFALREHKEGTILTTSDLLDFVDTHEDNNLVVTDTSPFVNAAEAVHLMTAHKAKGQEFGAVFITAAVDDIWASSPRGSRIRFPENLPIQFSGDTIDDQLRLLFVAMTRAKHTLDIFSFAVDDSGSEQVELSFLGNADIESIETSDDQLPSTESLLASTVPVYHGGPYVPDETALLSPLVENYRLSVTHLNNFLDIRYGGPENFLTSNLLRFPQPMSRHQVYGSAVHTALERAYVYLKQEGSLPDEKQIIEWFMARIDRSRLPEHDRTYLAERGKDALATYWQERSQDYQADDMSEYNFRKDNVVVDEIPLVGKLDKIRISDDKVTVYDFKTGSSFDRFSASSVKAENYRRQLIFYKLLVENSAAFVGKEVEGGVLEFIEPKDESIVTLPYEITADDVTELKQLIRVVYDHIVNLEFPDTSSYSADAKGVKAFQDDLLKNNL
ncbi:MAG: ATP-dependent DNA helicase [Candidatus Paceibacterota bacterium]